MTKGRPKLSEEQCQARKLEIIKVARHLFSQDGYSAVSMRKVAAEAGLSPMTLYQSFENKRDLLRYIWTDIFIEISKQCRSAVEAQSESERKLHTFCETFLHYWLNNPEHYRVVYLETDQLDGSTESYFADEPIITDLFTLLAELIGDAANNDVDVEFKSHLLTLQIQGIAHGLIILDEIPWGDANALLSDTVNTFKAGLN